MHEPYLMTSKVLESQLGVSRSTLWRLRQKGLPSRRVGGVIRYSLREVEEWLQSENVGKLDDRASPGSLNGVPIAQDALKQLAFFVDESETLASDLEPRPEVLPPCHWSPAVALDPKHRPQAPNAPATTVRKDWRKYPQEAHLLDLRGDRFRRFTEDEIAVLQGFPSTWGKEIGLTHRERIAGLGNAVPPPLGEAIYRALSAALEAPPVTAIEICAGFGGMALGAHRAGLLETLALVEFWEAAVRVLRSAGIWDPSTVHLSDVPEFEWGPLIGKVDVLSGGPPCQPWSQAGHSKGADDKRDLLGAMPGLVRLLSPKAFVFENVPGLMSPTHRDYLEQLVKELRESGGYGVAVGVVQAADFGVPQKRRRIIIAGIRGQGDGAVHEFFDALAGLRTHADPGRALPPGRAPWVTIAAALPDWSVGPGWRRWLSAPEEISQMIDSIDTTNNRGAEVRSRDLSRLSPSMGLTWPGRNFGVRWSGNHWILNDEEDIAAPSATPLLRSENTGRPLLDPWYLKGDQIRSLEALRPALGRRGKLVYFEPPRLDTDLVSFAAEDSRNRLNTWLTLNQATIRRAVALVRDDGVLVILAGSAEQPYLQVMLDEMFGPENRVGTVVWQKGYSVQGQKKDQAKKEIYPTHDYLLIYSRRREQCLPGAALKGPPKNFSNPDGDPRGPWKAEQKGANYHRESSDFSVNLPPYRWEVVGGDPPSWFWRVSPKSGVIWAPADEVTEAGKWSIRVRVTDSEDTSIETDLDIEVLQNGAASRPVSPSWLIARDSKGNLTREDVSANKPATGGPLRLLSTSLPAGVVGQPFCVCLEAAGGSPYAGTTRPGKNSESGTSRYWDLSYQSLERAAAEDAVDFKERDDSIPAIKVYLDGASFTYVNQISTWRGDGRGKVKGSLRDPARVGWGQDAKKELEELLRRGIVEKVVNIGKPAGLMTRLLGLFTDDGDSVVDIGSSTSEMASLACQLRRRAIYVEMPGTHEDAVTIRMPRLKAAARGDHPIPEGALFFGSAEEPDPHGFYVGRKPRDRQPEADICTFEVGAPILIADPQTKAPRLDYTTYPSGSVNFLQALASVEGLVWQPGPGTEFAQSHDGRVIALHIDGRSVLDGRTIENIELTYATHLTTPSHSVRVYFHRGYEDVQPPGGLVELRHVPFELVLAGSGWP